jgi:hypothetical protein
MSFTSLTARNISTTSPARAVQDFNKLNLDLQATNAFIAELVPTASQTIEDPEIAQHTAGYLIQFIVKNELIEPLSDSHELDIAIGKARTLIDAKPKGTIGAPLGVTEDGEASDATPATTTSANGTKPKRERGEKSGQAKAQKLFDDNPTLTRRELIDLMVTKLSISSNTGSTYFAMFNKTAKRATGGVKGKNTGPRREDQVREVFDSKPKWKDRGELVEAIMKATGCTKASANTFSYRVMESPRKTGAVIVQAPSSKKTAPAVVKGASTDKPAAKPAAKAAPAKKVAGTSKPAATAPATKPAAKAAAKSVPKKAPAKK